MKRGAQNGGGAATLVGVITLFFVFYILFLPAEDREDLFERNDSEDDDFLLNESPGRISYSQKGTFDRSIPNIYLAEAKNSAILASENPFIVKKGWFSEERKTFIFSISDLTKTENIRLSFQAPERHGTLVITLNNNVIFANNMASQNIPPLTLPRQVLAPINSLEFFVTGNFFESKEYSLHDVKVIADITDAQRQEATSSFTISETEFDNLESAFLEFYPLCDQRNAGIITLELNDRQVYNGVPSCDSLTRQDLFTRDLREGKNTITFRIASGNYRFEAIRIRTALKPSRTFIDYFTVTKDQYHDIRDTSDRAILRLEFVDNSDRKKAQLNINGRYDSIDQRDSEYEKDISNIIREGNNYIEIKPLTDLDIARLEIRVE